jgi:hypothetical protein
VSKKRESVDLGLWQCVDRANLIVPLDVHMGWPWRILGFRNDKTISRSTALKVTRAFAQTEPTDPVKYDFALSRIGILEGCTGQPGHACEARELRRLCAEGAQVVLNRCDGMVH